MDSSDLVSPHPHLEVISDTNYTEYRYYADKTFQARVNQRGFSFYLNSSVLWLDALVVALVLYTGYQSRGNRWYLFLPLCVFTLYAFKRSSRIVYESVIVIPPHGVQLETHRGPFKSFFVSRRFVPAVYIHDIIINEALRRWNVRYYLAIIVDVPGQNRELAIPFESTLPHFPVLSEVYHGVLKVLYDEKPT